MEKILFFFFGNNIDICCRKILASTLFFFIMAPKTSLIVLIFFITLVNRKLLFPTKYISKKDISGLIFFRVFIFFFYCPIALEIFDINFPHTRDNYSNIFTSIFIIFSTILSQISNFSLRYSTRLRRRVAGLLRNTQRRYFY